MSNLSKTLIFSILAVFLSAGNALSLDLGTNITIWDNRGYSGNPLSTGGEDQETEPGMVNQQQWDLEGFFLNGTTLTMVGGFDFRDGASDGSDIRSGDIFIDNNEDAQYGDGQDLGVMNFGYDYVMDLDFSDPNDLVYSVYALTSTTTLSDTTENSPESDPWKYVSGGDPLTGYQGLTLDYTDFGTLTDDDTGFLGGSHNAVSVDLGFLGSHPHFTAHFTMECGNDNLMAHAAPEPATMLLLGSGLIGLAGFMRRYRKT